MAQVMAPTNTKENSHFPFLRLPGEIQNRIYKLCLTVASSRGLLVAGYRFADQDDFRFADEETPYEERFPHLASKTNITPNLLCVCKKFNNEATAYLYRNKLHLANLNSLHTFSTIVGDKMRFVEHIDIGFFDCIFDYNIASLDCAVKLTKINFPCLDVDNPRELRQYGDLELDIISWARANKRSAADAARLLVPRFPGPAGWRTIRMKTYLVIKRMLLSFEAEDELKAKQNELEAREAVLQTEDASAKDIN